MESTSLSWSPTTTASTYNYYLTLSTATRTKNTDPASVRAKIQEQVFYDGGQKEVIVCTDMGTTYKIVSRKLSEHSPSQLVAEIPNIGVIEDIKFSCDRKFLGIKGSSPNYIDLYNIDAATFAKHNCRQSDKKVSILGYFWTNASNLLLITTQGVEFYELFENQIKMIKEFQMGINWFVYSAKLRILLVSTSARASMLQGFHFTLRKNTVIKLPKFDVFPATSTAPLLASDIVVAQIYSALYCIHIKKQELVLHQLNREQVTQTLTINLHTTGSVDVHVIDNLIITHNRDQQISMIFDIKLREEEGNNLGFPVAAPLPLSPAFKYKGRDMTVSEVYTSWRFYLPSVVISEKDGFAWTVNLSLVSFCSSFSDRLRLVEFLLNREQAKSLLLEVLQQSLCEKEPLLTLTGIFDLLSRLLLKGQESKRQQQSQEARSNKIHEIDMINQKTTMFWKQFMARQSDSEGAVINSPVKTTKHPESPYGKSEEDDKQAKASRSELVFVSQKEFYLNVLMPVRHKVEDKRYFTAVVIEYIKSLNNNQVLVKSYIFELLVELFIETERFFQLHQFMQYQIVGDCFHIACQLLSLEDVYPACFQLALDMLKRLGSPEHIVEVLLAKGHPVTALRYVRGQKNQRSQNRNETILGCST